MLAASPAQGAAPAHAAKVGDAPTKPWEHWVVSRPGKPDIDLYALRDDARKPVVVFFPGSHCVPLFFYRHKDGKRRLGSTILFQEAVEVGPRDFHFVAVERRLLKSFIELSGDDLADHCSPEHGSVSKADRVEDAADAVTALALEPWVGEVLVAGHSEGADVASGVARILGDGPIRAVGSLSGGGPSQFFDHVMEMRRERRDAEAQGVFDELLKMTSATPPDPYRGHPVERYRSFALRSTQLDDLRDLDVPVFIAHGTRDRHSAIESADLLAVELLRANPRRLVDYLVLAGLDHGYVAADGSDHQKEVLDAFVKWATDSNHARNVETRFFQLDSTPTRVRVRYFGIDSTAWRIAGVVLVPLLALVLVWTAYRRRRAGRGSPE